HASPRPAALAPTLGALTQSLSLAGGTDSGTVVTTGGVSPFIWNLEGQGRAQMLVYQQEYAAPLRMWGAFVILAVPLHLKAARWPRAQGWFALRHFADRPSGTHLPHFNSVPAVCAFIPLARDGRSYAFDRAVWFPQVKYASQLEAAGELHARGGALQWVVD